MLQLCNKYTKRYPEIKRTKKAVWRLVMLMMAVMMMVMVVVVVVCEDPYFVFMLSVDTEDNLPGYWWASLHRTGTQEDQSLHLCHHHSGLARLWPWHSIRELNLKKHRYNSYWLSVNFTVGNVWPVDPLIPGKVEVVLTPSEILQTIQSCYSRVVSPVQCRAQLYLWNIYILTTDCRLSWLEWRS